MRRKYYKYILLVLLFTILSHNPDSIGGMNLPGTSFTPDNARIRNDHNESEYFSYMDRSINYFLRYWNINGASVAIARDGKLVFAKGYGLADSSRNIEVQPYHKFRIASISKLVTATAIMKLQAENRIKLNDKVFGPSGILNGEYFSDPRDKRAHDITVAHLLAHQGGWSHRYGDHMFMPHVVADFLGKELPVSVEDIVRFALDKRLHYTPGMGRSYSNLGYAILGLVIEEVSGMTYENYCKKKIFEPLGIYDFELARNLYDEKDPLEVRYYEPGNAILKSSIYGSGEMLPGPYGGNDIEALGAAGAWIGTAPDLLRFVTAVDGLDVVEDILPEASIEFMTDRTNGFAPVGWKATTANGYWWRTGSFAGTSAMIKRTPDGTLWAVLLNTSTWKSSMFTADINSLMSRAIANTRSWPEKDLFNYLLPVPLDTTPGI
ncbi:MAG: serine hydrolase domain-containing protein [Bacteroidales bacterium]|jgi:CubicO group peptidase (beta-lactamase class C family)|nr:serine hydrolase domain-containing protein [Bacteroidales bacterium]